MGLVHYTHKEIRGLRKHYVNGDDVDVVLRRLPEQLWARLQQVHFNDRSRGRRVLGYTNRGRHDVAICALPPHVSLSAAAIRHSPRRFGATRGGPWPELAVRRFLLYDVFLHELGHLQIVDSKARSPRRRFAGETKAQEFADYWRRRLWSTPFAHPDPVHNPPGESELERLDQWYAYRRFGP